MWNNYISVDEMVKVKICLQAFLNLFSTPSLADLDGITDLLPMQTGRSPFGTLLESFWSSFGVLLGTFWNPFFYPLTAQLTV